MRTKTYGVKNIFDAANQYSWFSLLYFGRTVQAACCFPSGKLLVWRGEYRFFLFYLMHMPSDRVPPAVGPQDNQGDIKFAEPKVDNFPRGWWNLANKVPWFKFPSMKNAPEIFLI